MGEFTYEQLFDVLRRERSRDELQQLDDGFYELARSYIAEQSAKVRSLDVLTDQGDKARTELANAKKLLRELYDRREKKIVLLALNKARTGSAIIDTSALLASERELFSSLVDVLGNARGSIASVLHVDAKSRAAAPAAEPATKKTAPAPEPTEEADETTIDGVTVRITTAVPKFMGSSSETFGPYEEGQEVELPERIAQILVKKGRAENA